MLSKQFISAKLNKAGEKSLDCIMFYFSGGE